jgi:hypothetical protein
MPLDPGRNWLEAGITGIPRQREWDAVATAAAAGQAGDEAEFVALADGRFVVEAAPTGFDPGPLAAALAASIAPPYRAVALCRGELWAVGARSIEVTDLDLGAGDRFELVANGQSLDLRVDGMPSSRPVPELERLGELRSKTYVVRAARLAGSAFEVEVERL